MPTASLDINLVQNSFTPGGNENFAPEIRYMALNRSALLHRPTFYNTKLSGHFVAVNSRGKNSCRPPKSELKVEMWLML